MMVTKSGVVVVEEVVVMLVVVIVVLLDNEKVRRDDFRCHFVCRILFALGLHCVCLAIVCLSGWWCTVSASLFLLLFFSAVGGSGDGFDLYCFDGHCPVLSCFVLLTFTLLASHGSVGCRHCCCCCWLHFALCPMQTAHCR